MILFPYKQKLITCLATTVSCECNWSLRRLQVKIENIYLFKILIKKHENVFKSWLCPNFLLLLKNSELPKIWGGGLQPPPRAPGPYAYGNASLVKIRLSDYGWHRFRFTRCLMRKRV